MTMITVKKNKNKNKKRSKVTPTMLFSAMLVGLIGMGSSGAMAFKDGGGKEINEWFKDWNGEKGNWQIGEEIVSLVPDPRLPVRSDFQVLRPDGSVATRYTAATHGIMVVKRGGGIKQFGLVSKAIGPSLDTRLRFTANKNNEKYNHVEVHAAAILNRIAENEALLMINYEGGACSSCVNNVQKYLKSGKTLYVVWRSSAGWFDKNHYGMKFDGSSTGKGTSLSEWPTEYKMEEFGISDSR